MKKNEAEEAKKAMEEAEAEAERQKTEGEAGAEGEIVASLSSHSSQAAQPSASRSA